MNLRIQDKQLNDNAKKIAERELKRGSLLAEKLKELELKEAKIAHIREQSKKDQTTIGK